MRNLLRAGRGVPAAREDIDGISVECNTGQHGDACDPPCARCGCHERRRSPDPLPVESRLGLMRWRPPDAA